MINDGTQLRLERVVNFLKVHSVGIFDDKPHAPDEYFADPRIAQALDLFPERIKRAVRGDEFDQRVGGIEQFLRTYKELRKEISSVHFHRLIAGLNPDLILDPCVGDKWEAAEYVKTIRRLAGTEIRFVGIDRDQSPLRSGSASIPNSEFYCGEVMENGTIIFSGKSPKISERIALVATNVCGSLCDSIARYVINNDFAGFAIKRCCYNQITGPMGYSDVLSDIIVGGRISKLLSPYSREPDNAYVNKPERIFTDLIKFAINLDLALRMQNHGYNVNVERVKQGYMVYGKR